MWKVSFLDHVHILHSWKPYTSKESSVWTSRFVLDTALLLLWATAPVLGSQARKPSQKGKLPLVGPSQLLQNELWCARITYWAAPRVREHRPTLGPTAWELHMCVLCLLYRNSGFSRDQTRINIWNKPLPFSSKQDCFTSNTSNE